MTGSAQHELAKYLSFILKPVLNLYSINCVKESFIFAQTIRDFKLESTIICSFNISSLFTNVALNETINICAKVLQGDSAKCRRILKVAVETLGMRTAGPITLSGGTLC